jgi:hypothetical protein
MVYEAKRQIPTSFARTDRGVGPLRRQEADPICFLVDLTSQSTEVPDVFLSGHGVHMKFFVSGGELSRGYSPREDYATASASATSSRLPIKHRPRSAPPV